MVALLVLGILLAGVIPTFLRPTNAANGRSVPLNLATALTDAEAHYQNGDPTHHVNGSQDSAGFATLPANARLSLAFKAGPLGCLMAQGSSGSMSVVSGAVSADGSAVVAAYSLPGDCFYGTIGLLTGTSPNCVLVKGDTTPEDRSAHSPRTSGSPATVPYLTSGCPKYLSLTGPNTLAPSHCSGECRRLLPGNRSHTGFGEIGHPNGAHELDGSIRAWRDVIPVRQWSARRSDASFGAWTTSVKRSAGEVLKLSPARDDVEAGRHIWRPFIDAAHTY
ncbi:MAG TPA: hypothetical protein VII96_13660 [Acidimicrobiales bacterium]